MGEARRRRVSTDAQPGIVYLVGGGPGDPGLLTVRGRELLSSADAVLHDELVHRSLLDHARPDAEVAYVGKRGFRPEIKQARQSEITSELVERAKRGQSVVRLKGGDPFLFGRGSEEAEALADAGVPFEVVPGVSAPSAATSYAGMSLTHRDLASSVLFVSATKRNGEAFDWSRAKGLGGTLCVFMGIRRLESVVEGLVSQAELPGTTPAAIIEWGTRAEQRVIEGTLATLVKKAREADVGNPGLIVVGEVVHLRAKLRWWDAGPLFGKRIVVARAAHQAAPTAELLLRRGAIAVRIPMLAMRAPPEPGRIDEAIAACADGKYDAVAFTSENGVLSFFRRMRELGRDARIFGKAQIAAIGPGTARALAEVGVLADIVPAHFQGEDFAEALKQAMAERMPLEQVRVLLPRALVAREVIVEMLRTAGVSVDVVPVYETVGPSEANRVELVAGLEAGNIDAIMLTSSSTVSQLVELLGEDADRLLSKTLLASIGEITTNTARELGLDVGVTATTSTIPGLVDAIADHFG